ncbi:MAG TPA: alpha-hydroxy-acid oxidizing protein, partial [Candidatus Binatus sp.]|nr:alpha-hydroxy-acid oxidizing protein [Candidatus Binatus sp.]
IVERVSGRIKVLFDSGVRRGVDVFKALALGADAVGVGRPVLYGLALAGAEGVTTVLEHLRMELVNVMRLAGVSMIEGVDQTLVRQLGS